MTTRRDALKLAAAGLTTAVAAVSARLAPANEIGAAGVLCRAVFDERYGECRVFSREIERRGVAISSLRNDVAALWYQDLRTQLRVSRLPFAGLTDRAALFCLEELSRDVGMRVRIRVDRIVERDGRVRYEVNEAADTGEAARRCVADESFGCAMARLASELDSRGAQCMAAQKRTGPFDPPNGTALVAWVIA